MDKKRLLELAGVTLTEDLTPLRDAAVRAVTDWYLDVCKDVYDDMARDDALPPTERGFLEIMKDILGDQIDLLFPLVRDNLDKELPPIIRTLKRKNVAQKRQRRE